MNKLLLLAGLAVPALMMATPASAEWYVKAQVGQTTNTEVESFGLSDDIAYGAFLGTNVGPLRLEGGVQRLSADTDIGIALNANALDWQGTAYLDLPVGHANLYGGVGLDYIQAEASIFGTSMDGEGDGWHATAGVSYPLTNNLTLEGQVSRIDASLDFGGSDLDVSSYVTTMGLRLAL